MKTKTIELSRRRDFFSFFALLLLTFTVLPAKAQMMYKPTEEFNFPKYYYGGGEKTAKFNETQFIQVTSSQTDWSGEYIFSRNVYNGMQSGLMQKDASLTNFYGDYSYPSTAISVSGNVITSGAESCMVVKVKKQSGGGYTLFNKSTGKYIDVDANGLVETSTMPTEFWSFSWAGSNNQVRISRTYSGTPYYLKNCANASYDFCLSNSTTENATYGYAPRLFKKYNYYYVRGGDANNQSSSAGNCYDSYGNAYVPNFVGSTKTYKQIIYPKDSLVAGYISQMAFYLSASNYTGSATRKIKIYMKETDQEILSDSKGWVDITSDATLVYDNSSWPIPTSSSPTGWTNVDFSTKFDYSGTNNVVVAIYDYTNSSVTTGQNTIKYRNYIKSNGSRYVAGSNLTVDPAATASTSTTFPSGTASNSRLYVRFTIDPAVEEPCFSPVAGIYNEPQEVAITCSESGANIYYTTDGTTPSSTNGTLYTGPLAIDSHTILKSVAVLGTKSSSVTTATYEFQPLPPVFANTGVHSESAIVTIEAGDSYTDEIYYTTDGSTPSTTNGILYSEPFTVTTETVVKAIAVPSESSWGNSEVATGNYLILKPNGMTPSQNPDGLVLNKTFTPDGTDGNNSGLLTLESYVTGQSITINNVVPPSDIVLVLDYSSSMSRIDIPCITTTGVESKQSRIAALKDAVDHFLELIVSPSCQPSGTFSGMHHRVAFVTYGDNGKLWYNGTSPSYVSYADTTDITSTSPYNQAFYEVVGTDYKLAWSHIAGSFGSTGDNFTELEYAMPVVKNIFKNNSAEITGGTRNRMVIVFTDGAIGTGNWSINASTSIYDPNAIGYAEGKANYTLRKAYDIKHNYDALFYSVGIFPDEPIGHVGGISPYVSATLPNYYCPKDEGVSSYAEYEQHWADNVSRFMSLRSSNYPDATSMTNPGEGSNSNGFYIVATDTDELTDAFATISQTVATPSMSLSSQTVVEDVISDAFMLPEGADASDIKVYTANCTAVSPYAFDAENDWEDITDVAQVTVDGKHIYVTNFDFTANWCGENTTTHVVHGKKLILQIPVVRDISGSAQGGTFNTNAAESGVYNASGSQVGAFQSPSTYLSAPEGCFDFEDVAGTAYNTNGNLPAGWHGYITNTTGTETLYPPHVVSGSTHNFPYDGDQSLMLASGSLTNAISYATMPAMYFTAGNDMELSFYYKSEGTGGGELSLAIGYVTSIPADNASDWVNAFHSLETLPASAASEAGSVFTVSLSGVPTNEDVYITFKWYYNYTGLHAERYCYLDGVCVQEPETIRLWTQAVTSLSQVPSGGFVDDGNGNITINCKEGLAWLISYVNGLNDCDSPHNLSGKTVTLTADIDMSDYVWVPIGINSTTPFSGEFDGQYHTIDGIHIANATEVGYVENSAVGTNGDMIYTGMFGYVVGDASEKACVKNTFVTSGTLCNNYYVDSEHIGYLGGLVGSVAGDANIEFCETAMSLKALSNIAAAGGTIGFLSNSTSTVKACMSMCDIDMGEYGTVSGAVGGVVGHSLMAAVNNCFGNSTITGSAASMGAVIGLAVASTVKNLYAHPSSTGATHVASNSPNIYAVYEGGYSNATTFSISDYSYGKSNNIITGKTISLVDTLNSQIPSGDGYRWVRAAGSSINAGYPIVYPVAADSLACVSVDGKVLRFGELNAMIEKYTSVTNAEIFMYNNDTLTVALPSNAAAKLFIDENVALMQTGGDVYANVGITLQNRGAGDGVAGRDWHMFSTSLSDAPMGIYNYNQTAAAPVFPNTSANNLVLGDDYDIDPDGYFPAGISASNQFDFYSFYETQYHWINLKRASNNHWHEDEIDGSHPQIHYYGQITDEGNEEYLLPGKGYLVAMGDATANNNLMQCWGQLNNAGTLTFNQVTSKAEHMKGYNLLGNPYQSYLDFNEFAAVNEAVLWGEGSTDVTGYKAYLIYDGKYNSFDEYLVDNDYVGFSQNADRHASRYINMHQAFFIVRNNELNEDSVSVTYTTAMRKTAVDAGYSGVNPTYRGTASAPAYPLVNLYCTDSEGKKEIAVMEFERPLKAGSLKMKGLLNGKGVMYMRWDGDDLSNVFIDYMPDYVPVWFEAVEDGVFTITWNTANADFGYMHLIDHIAGVDYDCLAPGNDSYTFHATPDDMIARFRVVFKPLGIDEQEGENGENFAFFNGDELIVNGEGELSFIDVSGRVLATEHVSGQQSHIALPNVAEGLYVLRLSQTDGVRVQKIIVKK